MSQSMFFSRGGVENHKLNIQLRLNYKTKLISTQIDNLQSNCEIIPLPKIINSTKKHPLVTGYMCLAKNSFKETQQFSCTPRSPIIHHPCPVSSSISEAHINRNHSVVLTVEEGFCIHLSGYSAPLCHQCLDVPRNRWASKEIGPHFLQHYYS